MKTITLGGSVRFKDEFMYYSKKFSLQGNLVLMPNVWSHIKDGHPIKEMLQLVQYGRIVMSDEYFCINRDYYIGNSTMHEIEFADMIGVKVRYALNRRKK